MRFAQFLVATVVFGVTFVSAAPPASAPATKQADADATLCQGLVHYTVPAGWKLRGKAADEAEIDDFTLCENAVSR